MGAHCHHCRVDVDVASSGHVATSLLQGGRGRERERERGREGHVVVVIIGHCCCPCHRYHM